MKSAALALLLIVAADAALAAPCKQKRNRDPSFIELAVPDDAIRPTSAADFAFVDDDVSYDQLVAKVGPPDASQGTRINFYIWCFADGSELSVASRDRVIIEYIRHNGRQIYKRGRKK